MDAKRFLVIYHSFTRQAGLVADRIAEDIQRKGGTAQLCRVDFADPDAPQQAPVPFSVVKVWSDQAKAGTVVPVTLTPDDIDPASYDHVILLSNTWSFHPSVPIQSVLRSDIGKRLLAGKKVAIGIVCRGFYKKNLAIVRDLVTQDGGQVVAEEVFTHAGSWLLSTITNVTSMTKANPPKKFGPFTLPPFGVSPASFAKVPGFVDRASA